METRLTLRPGMPGTKRLLARYGERLVCVRYLYDDARNRRLKTVELVIEEAPWHGRARRPRRNDHDLVGVRIARNETALRSAVKQGWRHLAPEAETLGDVLGGGAHPRHRSSSGHRMSTEPVQMRSI
jgi:hypothetical protein